MDEQARLQRDGDAVDVVAGPADQQVEEVVHRLVRLQVGGAQVSLQVRAPLHCHVDGSHLLPFCPLHALAQLWKCLEVENGHVQETMTNKKHYCKHFILVTYTALTSSCMLEH